MSDEVFNKVKAFVAKSAAVEEYEVTEDASLEDDLGIYGGDAIDFIIAFGKEFKVDVSNFMAADYFSAEGVDIIGPILNLFRRSKLKDRKVFTVHHLKKAIMAGRLDEDIINS